MIQQNNLNKGHNTSSPDWLTILKIQMCLVLNDVDPSSLIIIDAKQNSESIPEVVALYVFLDSEDKVLYVGSTNNLRRRWNGRRSGMCRSEWVRRRNLKWIAYVTFPGYIQDDYRVLQDKEIPVWWFLRPMYGECFHGLVAIRNAYKRHLRKSFPKLSTRKIDEEFHRRFGMSWDLQRSPAYRRFMQECKIKIKL